MEEIPRQVSGLITYTKSPSIVWLSWTALGSSLHVIPGKTNAIILNVVERKFLKDCTMQCLVIWHSENRFSIHIWDPFVGSGVHQIDGSAAGKLGGPVTVMTPMSPPSSCLILAATQHDGLLHLIDCRVGQVALEISHLRDNNKLSRNWTY